MKPLTRKQKIILSCIIIGALSGITIGLYIAFKDNLKDFISSAGSWTWFVYILVRSFLQVLLVFVPAKNVLFDAIAVTLFGTSFKTFIICFVSIVLGSFGLDLIGRYGGSKIIKKIVGDDDYNKASELVQKHGAIYIPLMYLLPLFPDDAICMVAGASKIKFGIHTLLIVFGRGIATATIVLGIGVLPPIDSVWTFVLEATVVAFWMIVLFKLAVWLDKKITNKKKLKELRK